MLRTHPGSLAVKPGTRLVARIQTTENRQPSTDRYLSSVFRRPCSGPPECVSSSRCQIQTTEDGRQRTDDPPRGPRRHSEGVGQTTEDGSSRWSAFAFELISCIGMFRTATRTLPSSVVCRPSSEPGGARRDRTDDLMLAKHALSQLSYGPVSDAICRLTLVGLGGLEPPTSRLSSARSNQLSYKPGSEDRGRSTDDRGLAFCHPSSVICRPKRKRDEGGVSPQSEVGRQRTND